MARNLFIPFITVLHLSIPFFIASCQSSGCGTQETVPPGYTGAVEAADLSGRVRWKIDAHTHITTSAFERARSIMDQNGIAVAVNLTPGFPGFGFETAMIMSHIAGGRILNMVNLDWSDINDPELFAASNARNLEAAKRLGAVGLKISKSLGLAIVLKDGSFLRVDDPRLTPIWKTAGDLKLPVFIHTADPVAFFQPQTPSNERYMELLVHPDWSFFGSRYPSFEDLLGQLEKAVAANPGTTFVGVHFGNHAENPDDVARMLDLYPNYFIDTAARVPEFGRHNADKMLVFFNKYQDRIVFGSDIGISQTDLMLGSDDGTEKTEKDAKNFYDAQWLYFETTRKQMATPTPIQGNWKIDGIGLPTGVLDKLYHRNAERLLGISITR